MVYRMNEDIFTRIVTRVEELESKPKHESFADYLGTWITNTGADNEKLNDVEDLLSIIDTILNQEER